MKEDSLKKMSTLNYIDSWAKQVRLQAMDMKKLFSNIFRDNRRNYSHDTWEIEDGINSIIEYAEQITDGVDEINN